MAAMTEEEKRAHIVGSTNENMFVEAGAGAGKTTLIVNRIVNQIISGISPKKIAAITFTNKAAEELRTRIQARLIEEADSNKEIFAVLDEVDQMPISTIHSFCLNILKEHAFEAGIRPDAEIYEDPQLDAEKLRYYYKHINSLTPEQTMLIKYYGIATAPKGFSDNPLFKMYKEMCELPSDAVISYDKNAAENLKEDSAEIIKVLGDIEDKIVAMLNGKYNQSCKKIGEFQIVFISEFISCISDNFVDPIERLKKIKKCKSFVSKRQRSGSLIDKSDADGLNKKCMEIVEGFSLDKFLNARERKINNYIAYIAHSASMTFRKRERTELISNNELIEKTEELIRTNMAVRKHYAEKLSCIYVDEFQDTDQLQASLIWLLAYDDDKKALRDGSLFIVGDPKQSIYRFRGADPQVYHDIKSKPEFQGHVYVLNNNFRSNPAIINWVNDRFNDNGKFKGNSFDYSPMSAGVPKLPDAAGAVLDSGVYFKKSLTVCKNTDESVAASAEETAELISELVNKKVKIPNRRKTDGCMEDYRPVEYGDFLVLFSINDHIPVYADAMRKRNIPVNVTGKVTLDSSAAIKRFMLLYNYCVKFIKHPMADAAVQLVFGNVTQITDEMTEAAKKTLMSVKACTKGMDGFAVAQFLIRNVQYYLLEDTDLTADTTLRIIENLEHLLSDMLIKCKGNRIEAADMFAKNIEKGFEKNLPLISDNSSVRLMTAHKAKGLEGNIVIWSNRPNELKTELSYRKYGTPVKFYADAAADVKLAEEAKQLAVSERRRLEYVIATRAKEVFIVMSRLLNKEGLLDDYEIDNCPDVTDIIPKQADAADDAKVTFKEFVPDSKMPTYSDEQLEKSFVTLNPSSFKNHNAVIDDEPEKTDEPEAISEQADDDSPKGDVYGTALHRCYELLINEWKRNFDMSAAEMQELIRRCVYTAITEASVTVGFDVASGYAEELKRVMNWFIKEKLFTDMLRNSAEIFTELSFSYYTSADESAEMITELSKYKKDLDVGSKSIWVNGVADLVLKGRDGSITVIDYKSDIDKKKDPKRFGKLLTARYEGQLTLYRYAMGKIFGVTPDSVKALLCSINALY